MNASEMFRQYVEAAKANEYRYYSTQDVEVTVNGQKEMVTFHNVGCNASHEFWLGKTSTGEILQRAIDCCFDEEDIYPFLPGNYVGHW